jgi:Gluconate 2-dehydrogenase subunit 3
MSEKLGEQPAPQGAPQTSPEPGWGGGFFETGRPRLGGLLHPVPFSDEQVAVLNAVADTIIPPADGWPSPSEVDVVPFIGRYVTPAGYRNKHYPFATEDEFKAGLDQLGKGFVDGDVQARTEAVAALESAEDPLFEQLRALVYYGYYSRPEVTIAIRRNIPAGHDFHGPPLPYGYLETTEPWDEETLSAAGESANAIYVETDDVRPVDVSGIEWVQRQQNGQRKEGN